MSCSLPITAVTWFRAGSTVETRPTRTRRPLAVAGDCAARAFSSLVRGLHDAGQVDDAVHGYVDDGTTTAAVKSKLVADRVVEDPSFRSSDRSGCVASGASDVPGSARRSARRFADVRGRAALQRNASRSEAAMCDTARLPVSMRRPIGAKPWIIPP